MSTTQETNWTDNRRTPDQKFSKESMMRKMPTRPQKQQPNDPSIECVVLESNPEVKLMVFGAK
jgi:hypothetical protein